MQYDTHLIALAWRTAYTLQPIRPCATTASHAAVFSGRHSSYSHIDSQATFISLSRCPRSLSSVTVLSKCPLSVPSLAALPSLTAPLALPRRRSCFTHSQLTCISCDLPAISPSIDALDRCCYRVGQW